ncbi:helix-turn-helix domain-containing protein [Actinosynnema mirum]|uniref:DNA binding domain protein, excisionase family n=1 Tax=Actinosynnema mirum (strain ATCC 29888 / DSM 43827 / JCM 3225 / NBRC 14064 / NCIMB 13271 / NRRL B-12336 / IMRU 3971 / 101) TaxID=446462 RepID=C6WDQ1_ACTMD|nr:helix-turn-helix domain-containing protein [Actinosynnema mirum]ACU34046.1 DNA binding domain protein, excisionase family [Actinosynnema mirum DSM 43827]
MGATERDVLFANEVNQRQAQELIGLLSGRNARFTAESDGGGAARQVPAELSGLIAKLVHAVARGQAVTVTTMPEELTTTAAAQLLGISRPTLMRKVNAGEIPSRKVGAHTRLRTEDVLRERRERRQRQLAALDELRDLEEF